MGTCTVQPQFQDPGPKTLSSLLLRRVDVVDVLVSCPSLFVEQPWRMKTYHNLPSGTLIALTRCYGKSPVLIGIKIYKNNI